MIGTVLGHYEIIEPLGAGGMGEVYRARDIRLEREVAIKVLPADFASDPERLARFEREAKLLASLNHPNIAAVYGLEDRDGVRFIAMELVEGETLGERIGRSGRFEMAEALEIARQIAEALEAAHERGVIHRDLKPANIKIAPGGRVKVLDFGLAKAFGSDGDPAEISPEISNSPTMAAATRAGVILGTAAYMGPEQARGRPVDRRTDIWAFGCVLYEMLAGRPAFEGETVTDILVAVVKEDPDWDALPAGTPASLDRLLRRCLAKDPARRLRDIGDARLEIEELQAGSVEEVVAAGGADATPWRRVLPWAIALVMGVAAIGSWLTLGSSPGPSETRPAQVEISMPPGVHIAVDTEHPALALSPDGSLLVVVGEEGGIRRLYLRELANPSFRPIAGTEGASSPFFSPDGAWIGFLADRSVKKVRTAGGVPIAVHYDTGPGVNRGLTWTADDVVVSAQSANSGLKRGDIGGDLHRSIDQWTDLTDPMAPYAWPEALPGGRHLLYTDLSPGGAAGGRVALLAMETGERETVVNGGTNPRYSSTGDIVFARAGSLYAVPFDIDRLAGGGAERRLVTGLLHDDNGAAQFAVGSGGMLAYVAGDAAPREHELVWVDRDGAVEVLLDNGQRFFDPRLSPDGARVALTSYTGANSDIWLLDLVRGSFDRLTTHPGEELVPVWSPEAGRLALASEAAEDADNPGPGLALLPISSTTPELLITSPGWGNWEFPSSWSRAGYLAYGRVRGGVESAIWVRNMSDGTDEMFVQTDARAHAAMFSPDGNWIAYVSEDSGRGEVYLKSFPDTGGRTSISTQGGSEPVWARSGREIFYRQGDKLMVVDLSDGPDRPAPPQVLLEGRFRKTEWAADAANYDVDLDGSRFVMVRDKNPIRPTVIQVVFNWPEALLESGSAGVRR
jgi:Tol biopolymer transport system component/predicted Ser/Thr protein kinase